MITNMGLKKLGFSEDDYVLQDDGDGVYIAKWNSGSSQPTKTQIETAHAQWQTEQDAKAYVRARSDAYPSVADFMEAYTEKEIGSSSTKWDAYVTAYNKVRSDNPKP
tara:strand:- start:338 stop:658 length:321 start_codon:yes stop_codon:yes gene_type:complete